MMDKKVVNTQTYGELMKMWILNNQKKKEMDRKNLNERIINLMTLQFEEMDDRNNGRNIKFWNMIKLKKK